MRNQATAVWEKKKIFSWSKVFALFFFTWVFYNIFDVLNRFVKENDLVRKKKKCNYLGKIWKKKNGK